MAERSKPKLTESELDQLLKSNPQLKVINGNKTEQASTTESALVRSDINRSQLEKPCPYCTRPQLPGNWIELTVLALIGGGILIWVLLG